MKVFFYLALISFFWGTSTISMWALKTERTFHESSLNTAKSIIVKKSTTSIINDKSIVSFVVDIERTGEYYLSCWMLGGEYLDGNYSSFDVLTNGKNVGKMNATKSNWQSVRINTETVFLQKGMNTISFTTNIPEIPNIEFIKIASTHELSAISSKKYDDRLLQIKDLCAAEKTNYSSISKDTIPIIHRNTNRIIRDGKAYYTFYEKTPIKYTFHTHFQFSQGENVQFTVTNVSGANTVFEIFHDSEPYNYSWTYYINALETNNFTINMPVRGIYRIRARSFQNARSGIVNIKVNSLMFTNVPTYSYGFAYTHNAGIIYNTFTANINNEENDPMLFISEGYPEKIIAYNDDSLLGVDFDWRYNSRIHETFTNNTKAILINEYSSYSDNSGFCDIYAGCRSCDIDSMFINLSHEDVIESAPEDTNYNCYSWAGGITSYLEEPDRYYSDYNIPNDDLASFDNYLSSERYYGCSIYSREGATEDNSVIDLWGSYDSYYSKIKYSHISIKHGADKYAHGYDWECKTNVLSRIFHPRYSLSGAVDEEIGGYGELQEHYRFVRTSNSTASKESTEEKDISIYTLEESIADGYSVLEHVQYTDNEIRLIDSKIKEIGESNSKLFETKYQIWKSTCKKRFSNLEYYRNAEYQDLLQFCQSLRNSEFLVYRKLGIGDYFSTLLLSDLTMSDNIAILENIKKENKKNKRNANDAIIVHSPYSNAMKYIKKLINKDYFSQTRSTHTSDDGTRYSNSDEFIVIPTNNGITISFNLKDASSISLSVIDLQGRVLTHILQNRILETGEHKYHIKKPATDICLVRYSLNGNLNIKKVYLK